MTGQHVVADVHCADCTALVGWKYVRRLSYWPLTERSPRPLFPQLSAQEASQKYKEGRFVLEKARILKESGWA